MSERYHDSIFWIEVEKIRPNPFQPRREFDPEKLQALAESIRQYGVLQPIAVTRKEVERDDGGLYTEYELIAGERRWRAAQLARLSQIPALIRTGEEGDRVKLEMAIIENLQREDLNPVDRARAFHRLSEEFKLRHLEIAKKVGRSREYVTNTIRILALPEHILRALTEGRLSEGHARPLLMLGDRPADQQSIFEEILKKKLTVRAVEALARRIAYDRVRKKDQLIAPEIVELEQKLSEQFGTRVTVEPREVGGRVTIDFFSEDDLLGILNRLADRREAEEAAAGEETIREAIAAFQRVFPDRLDGNEQEWRESGGSPTEGMSTETNKNMPPAASPEPAGASEDSSAEPEESDLYNIGKW